MIVTKLNNSDQTTQEYYKFIDLWNSNVPFVTQQTSGSTGKPKLIQIEKSKMIASAKMTEKFLKMDEMNNALLCISPNFIGGKMLIVRSLLCNLDLIIAPTSANPLKELETPVDFAAMVPLQVKTILKETPDKLDLIGTLIIGGAPVSLSLINAVSKRKTKVYSTFGMTETVSHIALKELNPIAKDFKAIGNTSFSTTADNRLVIHAPDLNIKALETNDIVSLKDPCTFEWLGRGDFVINSGGIKVSPEKLENILTPYIKQQFIIAGVPDQKLGEKIILISESKIDLDELKAKTIHEFEKYSFPKKNIVSKIHFTGNDKIDRIQTIKNIPIEG
jgi:O-succinylbenzoic acid--CoA ligase